MEYHLYLRPITETDLEIIHAWNLNPLILKQFNLPDNRPNSWSDTLAWWKGLGGTLVYILMATHDVVSATYWKGRPIGVSWIKNVRSEPEVGGYIGDTDYYKSNALVEMYNLLVGVVKKRSNAPVSLKVSRDNMPMIEGLQKYDWCIDCEIDNGMVQLTYGTVTVQNP